MKIIATSDWHLGNLFHGNDRLPEHRHFLEWLLERIAEQHPDALLVAGDVFDNGNPSAAAQSAYYEFLADATGACPEMQVVVTAGNHDSASRLEAPRPLLARHKVEVRGTVRRIWQQTGDGGVWVAQYDDLMIPIRGRDGQEAVVLAVPYLRSDVVGEYGSDYSHGVRSFLAELTAAARHQYPGRRLVMMAHLYAKGADIAETDASEKIVVGGLEEVGLDGWEGHPDYMACGHIHKRQHIWNTDWARYMGSVLPMSFAEKDYRHGADMVTFEPGLEHPMVEFLEYEPQHRLRIIESEADMTPNKFAKLIGKELRDCGEEGVLSETFDYVMLKVTMEKVSNDDLKKLEDAVKTKDAVLCKTQKVLPAAETVTITGTECIKSVDDILNRDPLETLREAYVIKHNREMTERQEAMLKEAIRELRTS